MSRTLLLVSLLLPATLLAQKRPNGDMTGVNWIAESGFLEGPILLTSTQ